MRTERRLGGLLAALTLLASTFAITACGSSNNNGGGTKSGTKQSAIVSNSANKKTTIVVGSKNFTEQKVLGEIFAQGLAAARDTIKTQLNLGDEKVQFKVLKSGKIDAVPEYTGMALGSFFGVASNTIPKDLTTAFDQIKVDYAK